MKTSILFLLLCCGCAYRTTPIFTAQGTEDYVFVRIGIQIGEGSAISAEELDVSKDGKTQPSSGGSCVIGDSECSSCHL